VRLTEQEKMLLNGEAGEAMRLAMAILVELGEAIGALEMVEVEYVHTDSGFYLGDAGLEFVEHLAALGGKVSVPTSMNNTSFDIERCRTYGVSSKLADKIKRLEKAHLAMGAMPSWTCAPYQDGILPKPGTLVAWSESNAIVFANSVLGARTTRTGDLVDICCALTGRAPRTGFYLDENRLAGIHMKLDGFPAEAYADERFYPLLGYYIGQHQNIIPAFTQRGHSQTDGIDAIIKIFSHSSFSDKSIKVLIGCHDQTKIGGSLVSIANELEPVAIQNPQQLGLHVKRYFAYLIQEQCASPGGIQHTHAICKRTGKSAFAVTKEFTFKQIFRYSAAVDNHKRHFTPAT
jgi:hypothetical protein